MSTGSDLLRRLTRLPLRWKLPVLATTAVLMAAVAAAVVVADRIDLARPAGDPFLDASFATLDESTEVVVLGSSHIFCNVRASRFDQPTVPLAMPNAKVRHLRELAVAAAAQCPNLKLAVVELSAVSLLPRADRVDEFEAEKRRQLDVALGIVPDDPIEAALQSVRRLPLVRNVAERDTLNPEWLRAHAARESGERIFERGFHGWSRDAQALVGEGENATVHAAMLGDDPSGGIREAAALVRELAASGVAVRFVRTPHYPSYAEHQNAAMARAPAAAMTALADAGVQPSDFWDDFTMPFDRSLWFDEDHLNVDGANRYSDVLSERIRDVLTTRRTTLQR